MALLFFQKTIFTPLYGLNFRFNVVYLIEEKSTGEKRIEAEVVDYNPIRSSAFLDLLHTAGFGDIQKMESGPNVQYTAIKGKST